ncbi:MAG: hypothetical protein NT093_03065 [Candidatus Moranbacteria bacterium]|nr:hypothetical protein [Candidatus Moranbacteria bacterium]
MKKNKKTIVSAVSAFALLLNLFLPAAAWAYTVSLPSLTNGGSMNIDVNEILQEANYSSITNLAQNASTDITKSTEQRFGINDNVWRAGQRKATAPRMELFFDNTNPKVGEKVTAHAVPEFFKNDPQNLYYTWYIMHTTDGKIQSATNSISEGKKEAAAIMARGDYDPNLDGQTYADPGKDLDNDGWPAVDNSYDANKTAAPMGGSDGVGGLAEETVSAFNTATEWCDSLGDHTWDKCSYDDASASKPLNTYFTLKSSQANHYCNLCKDYFSGDGAASYVSAQTARNTCCYTATPESSLQCSSTTQVTDPDTGVVSNVTTYSKCPQNSNTDYCSVTYNSLFDSCYDTFKESNKSIANTCLTAQYSTCKTDWATTHEDFNGDGFSDYSGQATVGVSRCFRHNYGTNADASVFRANELSDSATSDPSGLDYPVACKHKWVNSPDYKSGSGKFTTGEEKNWKTDPTDPDTDGDGFPDGADVIGLGQQDFTWNYQSGDRIGVVAEGTSMIPVEEMSAYYKIMWGYMDVCDSTKVGLLDNDECDGSGDYGSGFLATESPSEQGDDKLKISLSFSPETPLADPSDENKDNILSDGTIADADQITITSSLDNTNSNPGNLYYSWQISKGDPQKDDWMEIKDIPGNFLTNSPAAGMGVSEFSFTPKKSAFSSSSGINYFKVTLTASKSSGLTAGRARSSVIIPVNTQGIKIALHKVDIKDGKAAVGDEICNDGLYKTLCPVVKGQMVAAEVLGNRYTASNSEFSWKINNNPVFPPANASELFDGWSNTTVFFPITKNEQGIENISVTATSKDELQPATGARFATVVHPAVFIKSGDTSLSWPKTYVAEDPNQKSTYQNIESSDAFESLTNSNAPFYLDFVPYYLLGEDSNSQIKWSVNGTDITSTDFYANNPYLQQIALDNNDRTIKLATGENVGTFTALSAEVKKYWSDEERGIAYTAWGVAPNTLSGESTVSIESVNATSADIVGSANSSGQILAAIGTHLPHYFMYLLRLVLTMAVMFIVSAGFYGVTQRLNFAEDEK